MRFAVISDIHGNRSALEAVFAALERAQVDEIVNLGDSLSGPFDPAGTADLLIARDIPSVCGNHDRLLLDPPERQGLWEQWTTPELRPDHFDWVRALPETITMENVHITHATPGDDAENWLDRRAENHRMQARDLEDVVQRAGDLDAALVLTGHTHTPRVVRLPGGPMVVNPGSVGCPAYLDDRTNPPFIHETGAPDARFAIIEMQGETIEVALCSTPYDPTAMAKRARDKGAETWAQAIETGWFTSRAGSTATRQTSQDQ